MMDDQIGPLERKLHDIGYSLGVELQELFDDNYPKDWKDEEAVTHALLGAFVQNSKRISQIVRSSPQGGITLKATFTKKHDEAGHGIDALIRFRCDDPDWNLSTSTLLQSKRHEPGTRFSTSDYQRLSEQIQKMLFHTTEAFVMIFSEQRGIQLFPAVSVLASSSRDPFELTPISWPWFLSGIFRGRMGEIVNARIPAAESSWLPMWELDIVAQIVREQPLEEALAAPA